jgi:hypothetical protein
MRRLGSVIADTHYSNEEIALNESAPTADERSRIEEINRQPSVRVEIRLHRSGILALNNPPVPAGQRQ